MISGGASNTLSPRDNDFILLSIICLSEVMPSSIRKKLSDLFGVLLLILTAMSVVSSPIPSNSLIFSAIYYSFLYGLYRSSAMTWGLRNRSLVVRLFFYVCLLWLLLFFFTPLTFGWYSVPMMIAVNLVGGYSPLLLGMYFASRRISKAREMSNMENAEKLTLDELRKTDGILVLDRLAERHRISYDRLHGIIMDARSKRLIAPGFHTEQAQVHQEKLPTQLLQDGHQGTDSDRVSSPVVTPRGPRYGSPLHFTALSPESVSKVNSPMTG